MTSAGAFCIQLQHQWAAKSLGQSRGDDLVLQRPQVSCLLCIGVCRAGFSSLITAFAFLVFWSVGGHCSEVFLEKHPYFVLG